MEEPQCHLNAFKWLRRLPAQGKDSEDSPSATNKLLRPNRRFSGVLMWRTPAGLGFLKR
jgi:hypothetical protein